MKNFFWVRRHKNQSFTTWPGIKMAFFKTFKKVLKSKFLQIRCKDGSMRNIFILKWIELTSPGKISRPRCSHLESGAHHSLRGIGVYWGVAYWLINQYNNQRKIMVLINNKILIILLIFLLMEIIYYNKISLIKPFKKIINNQGANN